MVEATPPKPLETNKVFSFCSRVMALFHVLFLGWYLAITLGHTQTAWKMVDYVGVFTFFFTPVANLILQLCFAWLLFSKRLGKRRPVYFFNAIMLVLVWAYLLTAT